ncbi:MAG: SIS domain-containing protein [Phycisphaeraceae bacterium]
MSLLHDSIAAAVDTFESLRALDAPLQKAADLLGDALCGGRKLLTCGNGGSAADASHVATEFVCRFLKDRRPYPAIALNEVGSTLTAIGNDYAFDDVFARQVHAFGAKGDVLIAFTTSGRSRNVIKALEAANELGLSSIAFLGRDGGATRGLATVELIVPAQITVRIQEAHQLLFHCLCELVEPRLSC